MAYLEDIHSPEDVKRLPPEALEGLCTELRKAIVDSVSQNGGHLASNLGAVELTVALNRVYDARRDRIIFDVGHQCYAHKMLTGRYAEFSSLRQYGGISGFPKPRESECDPCLSGHASGSVSLALGMARARTLRGLDWDVCAVIGDGALTGGLAYEGLADCGSSREPMLVILNDNKMSISSSVGGIARALARMRVKPSYLAFKRFYRRTIGRIGPLYAAIHRFKEWVKDQFQPDNMFEDMGFYYLGPIDGHDLRSLEQAITYARSLRQSVLLHVVTVKGKGYPPAEAEPELWHGVGPFDPAAGLPESAPGFSDVFGRELCELAEKNERIVAVTAAMAGGTGLTEFARRFPQRFFDVGIAEGHAAALCAGMASHEMRPVFAVYSTFLQRSFDMLIHDIGLASLPAVFAVDRAGLVGADGETHQGSFDVGYLRLVPHMKIYSPSDFAELRSMLALALESRGPAAVRYPRGGEGVFTEDTSSQDEAVLREGTDLTLVSYGTLINEALAAADGLEEQGISTGLIKLNRLDGSRFPALCGQVEITGRLIVAEEQAEAGGMGQALAAALGEQGIRLRGMRTLNLGTGVVPQGSVAKLRSVCRIDAAAMVKAGLDLMQSTRSVLSQLSKPALPKAVAPTSKPTLLGKMRDTAAGNMHILKNLFSFPAGENEETEE